MIENLDKKELIQIIEKLTKENNELKEKYMDPNYMDQKKKRKLKRNKKIFLMKKK